MHKHIRHVVLNRARASRMIKIVYLGNKASHKKKKMLPYISDLLSREESCPCRDTRIVISDTPCISVHCSQTMGHGTPPSILTLRHNIVNFKLKKGQMQNLSLALSITKYWIFRGEGLRRFFIKIFSSLRRRIVLSKFLEIYQYILFLRDKFIVRGDISIFPFNKNFNSYVTLCVEFVYTLSTIPWESEFLYRT